MIAAAVVEVEDEGGYWGVETFVVKVFYDTDDLVFFRDSFVSTYEFVADGRLWRGETYFFHGFFVDDDMPEGIGGEVVEIEVAAGDDGDVECSQKVFVDVIDTETLAGADGLPAFVEVVAAGVDDADIFQRGAVQIRRASLGEN